jgi:hypothetical protein
MQRHEVRFVVDAPPHRVWRMFHPKAPEQSGTPRVLEYPRGRMEVLFEGDEAGQGLVRTCEFPVPKYLGTNGLGRSWEVVTEARKNEYSRYQGVCKPLWARMEGWHELEPVDSDSTKLTFVELYDVFNPALRFALETSVHRFISQDNDRLYETILGYCGNVSRL